MDRNATRRKGTVGMIDGVFRDRVWVRLIREPKLQSMDPKPKEGMRYTGKTTRRRRRHSEKCLRWWNRAAIRNKGEKNRNRRLTHHWENEGFQVGFREKKKCV